MTLPPMPRYVDAVLSVAILVVFALAYAVRSNAMRSIVKWAGIASMFFGVVFVGGVYLLLFH